MTGVFALICCKCNYQTQVHWFYWNWNDSYHKIKHYVGSYSIMIIVSYGRTRYALEALNSDIITKRFRTMVLNRYDSTVPAIAYSYPLAQSTLAQDLNTTWWALIVGSGVRPPPFLFYPHPFYKGTLDTENSRPHPFSNLYVSYIHFWCHGNVVDWHPIAYWYITSLIFSLRIFLFFSILFCKYKCTTWKSEEPHPL